MRRISIFTLSVFAVLFAFSVTARAAAPAWQKLPDHHDWFGVYLQGKKVGYLESERKHDAQAMHTRQRMVARVAGMGQTVEVQVLTEHDFDLKTGKLTHLKFSQSSPTGSVDVTGKQVGKALQVTFAAGGETRALADQPEQTFEALHAGELMAIDPDAKVGRHVTVKVFDPSIQKVTPVDLSLTAIEKRMLDGIEVPVRHVRSFMSDMNIEEQSVYSADGRTLESHVGGLFTIRLEDEKRAKDIGYSQDVLVAFVVPVDKPITDPYKLDGMTVKFTGANGFVVPKSSRQSTESMGLDTRVVVKSVVADEKTAPALPFKASEFKNELKPEPLLQSDAPEIRALAQKVVGAEKNSYRATKTLLDWVHKNLEKAYVPAVSNALEVYKSRKGDCGEHAALFVALARAAGIPARPVVGITYWPPGNGFGYHAWAEVWLGKWVAVDPTQGTMAADATHVQLAGGDLAEQAKITMLIGKLKAQIEKTN